jgi:hypothetical protein
VLALQRSLGNRATASLLTRGPTVQRVKRLKGGDATLPAADEQRAQKMFTSHEAEPEPLADMTAPMSWGKSAVVDPTLLSSNDGTVVMQDTTKEPQEFYATEPVLAASVKALSDHRSIVGLEIGGATLAVGDKTLTKARAKSNVVPVAEGMGAEMAAIATTICIDVASLVLGLKTGPKAHAVVLGPKGGTTRTAPIESTGTGSDAVTRLAAVLGKAGTPALDDTIGAMASGSAAPADTGTTYGTRSGEGDFGASATALGVNEFAEPGVGEAFATYSVKSAGDVVKKAESSLEAGHVWGYHYAAVVAEAADKKDKVTLENYNRSSDLYRTYGQAIIAELGTDVRAKVETFLGARPNPRSTGTLYAKLKGLTGVEAEQAAEEIQAKVLAADKEAWNQWYFAMYGTKAAEADEGALADRTFHARAAATGFFENPLTVRVAAPEGATYDEGAIYRELVVVISLAPNDANADVRPFAAQQKLKDDWIETVRRAGVDGGASAAQARTRGALTDLRLRQCRAYWTHYSNLATKLVGATNVPATPTTAAGYPAAMQLLATACRTAKAQSYRISLWYSGFNLSGEGATKLADAIATAGTYLAGKLPYYDKYLT